MTQPLAFDSDGIQFAWDSTSIKIAEECLYKYKLKMLDGWTPFRKSVHLIFGGLYATALEHYHQHVAAGRDPYEAMLDVVHEALIATWDYDDCPTCNGVGGDLGPEPFDQTTAAVCPDCSGLGKAKGTGAPQEFDHNTKTRENLIRTIIWYLDQFGTDDACSTVILSTGEAAVEHSFRLDVGNDIMFSGHLDRMVEYAHHVYVQDQKTTGSTITPRYFDQWNPDTQMSMYTFAGQAIFDLPIKGVMIDAAQIAVGFTRFERGFTFRDEPQLDEWFDSAMHHVEAARYATREQHFPMNTSSCNNFGGCQFRHVCSKSPTVREQFLKADFERGERWDPLKVR